MSINKIYLPELIDLKKYLKENGNTDFYNRYIRKREVFIGPVDSVDFIDEFCKNYIENVKVEAVQVN